MKDITRIIGIHASPTRDVCSAIKIDLEHNNAYVSSGKYWNGKGSHIWMAYDLSKSKDAFQIDHYIIDQNSKYELLNNAFKNHGLNTNLIPISTDVDAFNGLTDLVISLKAKKQLHYPNNTTEIQELDHQIKDFSKFDVNEKVITYWLNDGTQGDIVWAFLAAIYGVQLNFTNKEDTLI